MMAINRVIPFLLTLLLLSACSLLPEQVDETKGWSAQKFYNEATLAMSDGDYDSAIKYYEGLEARFPFGRYAMQAQLDVTYAYYKNSQPEAAIAAADRFIKLHPRNAFVDYAYYLKGIVNFNQNLSFLTRFIPTDTSQRDPGSTLDSFNDFSELVRRFPDSKYSEDARKRMVYLRNNLASHEVHVARYYMKRGAHMAAANRCVTVVEKYQRTPAVRDATSSGWSSSPQTPGGSTRSTWRKGALSRTSPPSTTRRATSRSAGWFGIILNWTRTEVM